MSRPRSAGNGKRRRGGASRSRNAASLKTVGTYGSLAPPWLATIEAGMYLTPDEALKVSAVWCAMDTIVRAIAPCPWNVFDVKGRKRELRPDDSLAYLLNTRPNSWTTALAFKEGLLWSALGAGDGNGYAEIQFDGAGRVAALWNLDPARVQPYVMSETGELAYRVTQIEGGVRWVEPWRIFHLRGPSLSGYAGANVLSYAARSIGAAAAAQQFAAAYFANGTVLSGYWSVEKPLPKATQDAFEKDWAAKHGGPADKHKSPILPAGMKFNQITTDPEKAQLIETRQFSIPDIARWFGVPLHKLMDPQGSQGYGTNIEQLGIHFVNDCLGVWAERLEQEADYKLLPPRPATRETKIDLSRHLRGDFKNRMEGYAVAKKAGVLSQNEIRESEGWNTVGSEGDVYLVETTMQPVERAIDPPEPPAPSMPGAGPDEPRTNKPAPVNTRPAVSPRDAVVAMVADAFGRHAKRIRDGRPRSAKGLADDCGAALALAKRAGSGDARNVEIAPFADALEQGEPPDKAAERFVESLWRNAEC